MVFKDRHGLDEGSAEAELCEATQKVQSSTGSTGDLLHCYHPVCIFSFSLQSLSGSVLETRQDQTAKDSYDCGEDH